MSWLMDIAFGRAGGAAHYETDRKAAESRLGKLLFIYLVVTQWLIFEAAGHGLSSNTARWPGATPEASIEEI
jgi:hypothetical protein